MSIDRAIIRYHNAASAAGLDYTDAEQLRRDAQRLHRIAEHECNGTLYRAEEGDTVSDHRGRPLIVGAVYQVANINGPGPHHYYRTADRETPARARIEAIAAKIGARVEYQGDPRGWPVSLHLPGDDRLTLDPPVRP